MPERPRSGPSGRRTGVARKCRLSACLEGARGAAEAGKGNACRRSPAAAPGRARHPTKGWTMSERTILPVLPLRETVIFPGTAVPISAGRPGTLQAIEAALQGDRRMLAAAQKENRDEVEAENLYTVGTVVRIAQVQRGGGGVQLL